MKYISQYIILIITLAFFSQSKTALAITNPLETPNNHFGIHITNDDDIPNAAKLVNSKGGDWGYVTLVIRADDRDKQKWQRTFDILREKHLIPIVRLATKYESDAWNRPYEHEAGEWAGFLNSLNWVIGNRYVILFNEPNHAKEWGGSINPEDYTDVAESFITQLKAASEDFFVLPAGLDAAAPNSVNTMSSKLFMQLMYRHNSNIFTLFNGWNSHSYPNPNFTAGPYNRGINSITGYRTEIALAEKYGLKNDLPLFITETGWKHNQGNRGTDGLPLTTVNRYFDIAFNQIWIDKHITAITPFILNYQHYPFENFSWQINNQPEYYPWYESIANIEKIAGKPKQHNQARLTRLFFPKEITTNRKYEGQVYIQNVGQSIWGPNTITTAVESNPHHLDIKINSNPTPIYPGEKLNLAVDINTIEKIADHEITWHISHNQEKVSPSQTFTLSVKPPNIVTSFKTWLYQSLHNDEFKLVD